MCIHGKNPLLCTCIHNVHEKDIDRNLYWEDTQVTRNIRLQSDPIVSVSIIKCSFASDIAFFLNQYK